MRAAASGHPGSRHRSWTNSSVGLSIGLQRLTAICGKSKLDKLTPTPDGRNQSPIGTDDGRHREPTIMIVSRRLLLGLAASALLASQTPAPAAAAGSIRIAFGDIATVETLN